ncbi:MAG: MFS transporter [Thermoplasmata archaeon]
MQYKWTVLSNTTIGGLMVSINGTILLISLPVIFRGLNVNPFNASSFEILIWLLLGYGVVMAVLLVNAGRLADIYGRARVYNLGFAIFTLGSVLLFFTPNSGTTGAWELVGFRLVQAVGAAFLFANSAALLTDAFPPEERGKALGINQVAFIGGSLLGLIIGGILAGIPDLHLGVLTIPTWRLIFIVNLPVGVFGTVWAYYRLHDLRPPRKGERLDIPGNALFAGGLTLLLVGLTYTLLPYGGASLGWGNPYVWAAIVLGVALLIAFLFVEERVPQPMFRLALFRHRAFSAGMTSAFLGSLARGGMMLLLIIWFQGIWLPLHGYTFASTPFWSGVYMIPMLGGFFVFGPLSGWLSDRWGARTLATLGMVVAGVTFFVFLLVPYNFDYPVVGVLLFVQGGGMGMFAAPNAAAVMNSVPAHHRGASSGMLATLQNTGQQLSLVFFFTIVIGGLASGLAGSVTSALGGLGVGAPDSLILASLAQANPTDSLFAAFLGYNPIGTLLTFAATVPGWDPGQITPAIAAQLTSKGFFPNAIAPAFIDGLRGAFLFAGVITLVGAGISFLRGDRYLHEDQGDAPRRTDTPTTTEARVNPADPPTREAAEESAG